MSEINGKAKMFLEYEIANNIWVGYIGWNRAQELLSHYFAWLVNRKYSKYLKYKQMKRLRAQEGKSCEKKN